MSAKSLLSLLLFGSFFFEYGFGQSEGEGEGSGENSGENSGESSGESSEGSESSEGEGSESGGSSLDLNYFVDRFYFQSDVSMMVPYPVNKCVRVSFNLTNTTAMYACNNAGDEVTRTFYSTENCTGTALDTSTFTMDGSETTGDTHAFNCGGDDYSIQLKFFCGSSGTASYTKVVPKLCHRDSTRDDSKSNYFDCNNDPDGATYYYWSSSDSCDGTASKEYNLTECDSTVWTVGDLGGLSQTVPVKVSLGSTFNCPEGSTTSSSSSSSSSSDATTMYGNVNQVVAFIGLSVIAAMQLN